LYWPRGPAAWSGGRRGDAGDAGEKEHLSGCKRENEERATGNREPHPVFVEQLQGEHPGRSRADRNARLFKENFYRNYAQGGGSGGDREG
ncbi:unnamed protein product, partial [Ectocarpus sp. 13 AM-2016]